MAKRRRIRWDRILMVFGPLLLIILIICFSCGGHKNEVSSSSSSESEYSSEAPDSMDVTEQTAPIQTQVTDIPDDSKKELVVVIDAGHGGEDAGALNDPKAPSRFEKDDVLALAVSTQKAFRKYSNIRVIMTRETDTFVELEDRCRIANDAEADYFISIHRNSAVNGDGVEIWVNNDAGGDNSMDKLLATYIMELLEDVGISQNRGIKHGFRNSSSNQQSNNYYVNRYTNMPSCLIEMGFMSSEADNDNFDNHLEEYGEAIATAVVELVTDRSIFDVKTVS